MSLASTFKIAHLPATAMSASSLSEASSSLSAFGRRTPFPKSDVQIHIKNHYKTKTYTSASPISGKVTITTQRDVRFDSIEIVLLGHSMTRTEGYAACHESTHTFLKLVMPISDSTYPVPRVLENGRTFTIPFNFILPSFLTLSACQHKVDSDHVREQHLCLPPSMGLWARGNWEKDDLAPHTAKVVYSIKARVWREPDMCGRPVKVMEAATSIQVLPAFSESAPLTLDSSEVLYKMSTSKTLRKNIIASKLGTLTVSAQQPRAIILHPDGRVAAASEAQLDLHFTPLGRAAEAAHLPKITGVTAKIVAHTYFSAGAIHSVPSMSDFMKACLAERRGVYSTSVPLLSATLDSAASSQLAWSTHRRLARCDSGYGSEEEEDTEVDEAAQASTPTPLKPQRRRPSLANLLRAHPSFPSSSGSSSSNTDTKNNNFHTTFHTTSIRLPLTLPTAKKTFVPSFHSCIVSRVYTLHVTVAVDSATTTKLTLDLPVQIAVAGPTGGQEGDAGEDLPTWAEAVEEAAVDAFLRPRVLGVLEEGGGRAGSGDNLPGYDRRG